MHDDQFDVPGEVELARDDRGGESEFEAHAGSGAGSLRVMMVNVGGKLNRKNSIEAWLLLQKQRRVEFDIDFVPEVDFAHVTKRGYSLQGYNFGESILDRDPEPWRGL